MTTVAFAESIGGWWTELGMTRQLFYGIGIVAGLAAVVLAALTFFGMDTDAVVDAADLGGAGGGLFSIKPLTGFFLGFGWSGGIAIDSGLSLGASLAVAIGSGGVLMSLVVVMTRAIQSMRSDGTMRVQDAVGATGTVYVTIPPARETGGQVTVSFSGRQETLSALNAGANAIPSGKMIKVVGVVDSSTVVVEPLG